jgi:hypothetical protein
MRASGDRHKTNFRVARKVADKSLASPIFLFGAQLKEFFLDGQRI